MSLRCMLAVLDHSQAKHDARLVLIAIADYARDDGTNAYPSVATLAKKANISIRSARNALRQLEDSGEIETTPSDGGGKERTNIYRVILPGLNPESEPTPRQNLPPAKSAPGKIRSLPRQNLPPTPAKSAADPVTDPETMIQVRSRAKKPKRQETAYPEDFGITTEMQRWFDSRPELANLDIDKATEQWANSMQAKGYTYADWRMAWRNGMLNAAKWASERRSEPRSFATMQADMSSGGRGKLVL